MAQRFIPIEIEPVEITTTDKKKRKFLLSAGGMNRIKTRFGVKTLKEILELSEESIVPILYEALQDKGDLTEEQFTDIMPFNPKALVEALMALLNVSMPEPNPQLPLPLASAATGTAKQIN